MYILWYRVVGTGSSSTVIIQSAFDNENLSGIGNESCSAFYHKFSTYLYII